MGGLLVFVNTQKAQNLKGCKSSHMWWATRPQFGVLYTVTRGVSSCADLMCWQLDLAREVPPRESVLLICKELTRADSDVTLSRLTNHGGRIRSESMSLLLFCQNRITCTKYCEGNDLKSSDLTRIFCSRKRAQLRRGHVTSTPTG
jgi:hypothetical protein